MRLSVIMPAYNEGRHIQQNLLLTHEALQGLDCELIVVNDGSRDNTLEECQRAAARCRGIQVVHQAVNQGKGAACFHGVAAARGDLIAFLDADLEIAPATLLSLLARLEDSGADVVIGAKSFATSHFPMARRVLSEAYRDAIAFLFGLAVKDTQTGVKLFKRQVLQRVIPRMRVSRFAFDIELLVAATRMGYAIVECPVSVEFHRSGSLGRMNFRHMLGMLADTLGIFYRASFWSWLRPGLLTRLWMILFVAGVFLSGVGVTKLITPLVLNPPLSHVFYILALQFLPLPLRGWILAGGGVLMVLISLIQLNKSILSAFARHSRDGSES